MTDFIPPRTLVEALDIIHQQRKTIEQLESRLRTLEPRATRRSFGLRRFLPFGKKADGLRAEAQAILDSGLFDEAYYREQLKERAGTDIDKEVNSASLLEDYLLTGAFNGLDPGPGFDSDWYLAVNPDVQAAGANPLVHYVHYGLPEGRLPYRGAKSATVKRLPASSSSLNRKLWCGFSHLALQELRARVNQWFDGQAAWNLAAWDYVHGNPEAALEWLERSVSYTPAMSRRQLIGLAKCHSNLGDYQAISDLLADSDSASLLGSAALYVKANALYSLADHSERLVVINQVFAEAGLTSIRRKDELSPLALSNIATEQPLSLSQEGAPLVSVIIPAYNAGSRLAIALDSLLAQTWMALEIIVVDDASTDDTADIVQAYAVRDARVRYVTNVTNCGAYSTRNAGMRIARGEFVTVHDSDDWSHPQKIALQIQPLLQDANKVASCSSWVRVTPELVFVGPWMLSEHFVETNHSSCLLRRSALEQIGLWDVVNVAADTEFLWRLEQHFGHDALVHVLLKTPLSFALSDDSTLTRTKATHVKTIHYGLRRLYRESVRWWHRTMDNQPVMPEQGRPFPVPLGILRGSSRTFDALWAADFSVQGDELHKLLQQLSQAVARGQSLCLLHWPDYLGWHGAAIADEVFEFCQRWQIGFAHVGVVLSVPIVMLVDEKLWHYPPSQTVQLNGLQRVETLDGTACAGQQALLDYFTNGGVISGLSDTD